MTRAELLAELAARITRIRRDHTVRVGVDGGDAAGKTTLADELAGLLGGRGEVVIRASIDGFHHPAAIRNRRGPLSPEGFYRDSFNLDELIELLLAPLGPNGTRRYRTAIFDSRNEKTIERGPSLAPPRSILVFDGIFLHRPELRGHWDFSIFLRVDRATVLKRALVRDALRMGTAELVERRYRARYFPGQQLYLDECDPERCADLVIDNRDFTNPIVIADPVS